MSGLVEMWASRFLTLGKEHPTSQSTAERKEDERKVKLSAGEKGIMIQGKARRSVTLSEATVCMLMDRFAPS